MSQIPTPLQPLYPAQYLVFSDQVAEEKGRPVGSS
jgi:hypothetical protein